MRSEILAVAAAALIVAGTGSLAQTSHGGHGTQGTEASGMMSEASKAYMDAMGKMDAEMNAMEMSGDPGTDFAMMMIPHHQSAIDMAEAYLESEDQNPELTKLAEEIIDAQKREIAFLQDWLAKNGK